MILTPNGRFKTQTKICLSISNYHPEHWQPSWSVRTALVALIAFMPTEAGGAFGSMESTKKERRALAIKSREAAPRYGTPERQLLIDGIHQRMVSKAPPVPEIQSESVGESGDNESEVGAIDNQPLMIMGLAADPGQRNIRMVEDVREIHWNANAGPLRFQFTARLRQRRHSPRNLNEQLIRLTSRLSNVLVDQILTFAATGMTLAIIILVVKKFLHKWSVRSVM